jgi:predicted ABC-type ATPase
MLKKLQLMVKENHKPVLIVIAGPNGSGKTTITSKILRHESILNCKRCSALADRVYIYDNSIDDADARLMFRMTNGQLFKQYTDDIPEWAKMLV